MIDPIKAAILQHSIKLNSGRGGYIFDNRDLFLRGELRTVLWDAALKLWDRIAYLNPDVLVTQGMGGIPLALAMAGFSHASVLVVRDARKNSGLHRLVEGPTPDTLAPDTRAVFIDDLFNTGATYREARRAVEIEGYRLKFVGVAVLVDFWHGSRALRVTGTPVEALYRRHDFGITRKDATASLKPRVAWHVPHLNNDRGLDVKSWSRVKGNSLYVGSDDGNFHCFSTKTGHRVWTHVAERPQFKGNVCVPAFHKGNVIISSYDGTVRALGLASGHPEWTTKVDRNIHSSPLVVAGRVFVGTEYHKHGGKTPREWNGLGDIVALDADTGYELWRHKTDGMVPGTAAYHQDRNLIVCGSNDFHLYVIDADTGRGITTIKTRGEVKGQPLLFRDTIVTLSSRGWLQCFSIDSDFLLWERDLGGSIHAYPATDGKNIYLVNNKGMGMRLGQDGAVHWMVRLRGPVGWGFSWLGNDLAALTTSGQLVTIDPFHGIRVTSDHLSELPEMQGVRSFQPIIADPDAARFYVATNNRGLLAVDFTYDFPI